MIAGRAATSAAAAFFKNSKQANFFMREATRTHSSSQGHGNINLGMRSGRRGIVRETERDTPRTVGMHAHTVCRYVSITHLSVLCMHTCCVYVLCVRAHRGIERQVIVLVRWLCPSFPRGLQGTWQINRGQGGGRGRGVSREMDCCGLINTSQM